MELTFPYSNRFNHFHLSQVLCRILINGEKCFLPMSTCCLESQTPECFIRFWQYNKGKKKKNQKKRGKTPNLLRLGQISRGKNLESSRTSIFSQLVLKPENNDKQSVFPSRLGTDGSSFPMSSFAATWPHPFTELCELHLYENGFFFLLATHIRN